MKKVIFLILTLVMISTMILAGCGSSKTTTSPATTPPTTPAKTTPGNTTPATTPPTSTPVKTTPPTATGGPVYGGKLRIIYNAGPKVLGGSVEQGPFDLFVLLGGAEKLMEYNDNQELQPWLAQSVTVDNTAKTITIKLHPGIKCHDGSDFDADAVVWNFQNQVSFKRIGYIDQWVGATAVDKTTVVIQYTGGYNNQLVTAWLWSPPMWSKGAWDKAATTAGGATEWARNNFSGTGPFMLKDFQRDVSLTLTRFDGYWGPKPYLDELDYIFIPDSVTATAMMQAGEADMWLSGPVNDQLTLVKQGLVRQMGLGSIPCIYPNTVAQGSHWKDQRCLQAVEYALDKPAIAKALGQGQYTAVKMLSPEGFAGYADDYVGHPYNPAKAKQLLADAGYPNGFHVKLTALVGSEDTCTAIKQYLDAVGLTTDIDIADAGRFYGGLYGFGWDDLLLTGYGEGDMLANFHNNLGDQPLTHMSAASYALPDELLALSKESRTFQSKAQQDAIMVTITEWIADHDFIIPLWVVPGSFVCQPWLHTDYLAQGGFTFYFGTYWMDAHK
ncbi:MAG: ABC transporter substrate-binding protein [Dehalococcoidales bacterium]|jgi:ABC-type transport system substrate-binding protein